MHSHGSHYRKHRKLEVALSGHRNQASALMLSFKFKGGVKPETHKSPSVQAPIGRAPLPSQLVVPLHQSIGGTRCRWSQLGSASSRGSASAAPTHGSPPPFMPRLPAPSSPLKNAGPRTPRDSRPSRSSSTPTAAKVDRPTAGEHPVAGTGKSARAFARRWRRWPRRRSFPEPRQALGRQIGADGRARDQRRRMPRRRS